MTTTTITPEKIADLLDRAADRLERYGWFQGARFGDESVGVGIKGALPVPVWRSRCCADGAIQVSADWDLDGHELPHNKVLERQAREAFGTWLIDSGSGYPWEAAIWNWNDASGRTAEEVVAALRECAADARAETGAES